MEETNDLEQKQQYLREEILDKSYNVEDFSDYMTKYKENGLDLKNWEFIELKEVVKEFKKKVKEDEANKIEKGVENIRQSYRFNDTKNQNETSDEYLDINSQLTNNNNQNNNNNCVNNILNDYLKNKENELNKINKFTNNDNNKETTTENNNLKKEINTNIKTNNNFNDNKIKIDNKNFINNNINNNLNENNYTEQNKINNNMMHNNININNNNIYPNFENNHKEFEDFEILDKKNINNNPKQIIKCIKQSENSLTKKDNLYIDLDK